jgi:hypothetical protein
LDPPVILFCDVNLDNNSIIKRAASRNEPSAFFEESHTHSGSTSRGVMLFLGQAEHEHKPRLHHFLFPAEAAQ